MTPLLYVDLFCGAGGTTTGVLESGCAEVVACVNHDANAIKSHAANHPDILHCTEDIRTLDTAPMVDRMEMVQASKPGSRRVLWASCECTNFSKAKGGQSRDADSRTLVEHLYRYIHDLDPEYVQIENVTEFLDWGPLIKKRDKKTGLPVLKYNKKAGKRDFVWVPDPAQKGKYFRAWKRCIMYKWWDRKKLKEPAYTCEYKVLNAADFGARTSRKRLFVQFVKKGLPIAWPVPEYDKNTWKAAKEVLDLGSAGKSIFSRKKDLCDKTLLRICEGIKKFCPKDATFVQGFYPGKGHVKSVGEPMDTLTTIPNQYLTKVQFMPHVFGSTVSAPRGVDKPAHSFVSKSHQYPTTVFMMNYYSGGGQLASVDESCPALTTNPKQRLVRCQFLDQQYGKSVPTTLDNPFPSLTGVPHHSVVSAYIRGSMRPGIGGLVYSVEEPVRTLLARDYFYLDSWKRSAIHDNSTPTKGDTEAMRNLRSLMRQRRITDICMRPLEILECLQLMGFPKEYKLIGTQSEQRKFIGNAVEVTMAKKLTQALASANSHL